MMGPRAAFLPLNGPGSGRRHRRTGRIHSPGSGALLRAALLLGVAVAAPAAAGSDASPRAEFDEKEALAYSQAAIGRRLADHEFRDRRGDAVSLSSFRGKPLVLSFIYTSCYHTCPLLTKQLDRVVGIAREALGGDSFNVVTVGFDTPVDTPDRMRVFAAERGIDDPRWSFLSGDAATIEALTRTAGFLYFPSPRGFDHLIQTTIVDSDGRIYRQVYGELSTAAHLVEPLKQLVFGRPAEASTFTGWVNGVRLFCTVYDPTTGRYRFDYSIFVMLFTGIVALGSIAIFVVRAWRETSRRRAA